MKTSSLGDVVHNLPVASDIMTALPGSAVDWVVEEKFAAIPKLHHGVQRVIGLRLRDWRRRWWQQQTRCEIRHFLGELRATDYDVVIDSQGLFKSALVTRAASGRRYGMNWKSSREPLFMFYDRTFDVPRRQQAVERNRMLAALALGYALPRCVAYGIEAAQSQPSWLPRGRYAVLIHATSAAEKLWDESLWVALGKALALRAVQTVLPWGSEPERERSTRIGAALGRGVTPPSLSLEDVAALLSAAECVVGVDTGLTHLAAALGVTTVGIYVASDPALTGFHGCPRAVCVGSAGRRPNVEEVLHAVERLAP